MKGLVVLFFVVYYALAFSQDPEKLFNKALDEFDKGDFSKSEQLLKESLAIESNSYIAWYYLGVIYLLEKQYHQSAMSFNESCLLRPDYAKTLMYRGLARQKTTDYDGAFADYTNALASDSLLAEAYSFRGALYELFGDKKMACSDFFKASALGDDWAVAKSKDCRTRSRDYSDTYAITYLHEVSFDKDYGFSIEKPVMVGKGPDGGPANERAYLELLRDMHGNPLEYRRIRSCCGYKTENGIGGYGLLDEYEIQYCDRKGKLRTKLVYFSFYDYVEPQVLFGFSTVEPF